MERTLICSQENNVEQLHIAKKTGSETEKELLCAIPEHMHGEKCYEHVQKLVCSEEHEHTESCWENHANLTCSEQEHQHSEDCYVSNSVPEQPIEEISKHIHTEECFETVYICGFDAEYDHIHTLQCYSNPKADLETPEMWQASISAVELNGNWAEDLAAVAKTQLGYRESRSNYIVQDDGVSYNGYTRYGDWFGDPYGEWGAMFVSFCLHYAEIPSDSVCLEADVAAWPEALALQEIYESGTDHIGSIGDIIFFDIDDDGTADSVGIISDLTEDILTVIIGDKEKAVTACNYTLDDETILGYAILSDSTPSKSPMGTGMQLLGAKNVATDLYTYVVTDDRGAIGIQLLDKYGNLLSDTDVYEGVDYRLAFAVSCSGFQPGTYYYQLPAGVTVTDSTSDVSIVSSGGVTFGSWSVDTADNRLIFTFNENANNMQDVQITISFGVQFGLNESPIEFDGNIYITVHPEESYTPPTASLTKSGIAKTDSSGEYISWTVNVQGSQDYPLTGLTLTDTLLGNGYSSSGNSLWLEFRPPSGGYYAHGVYSDSNAFSQDGWTYTIPTSFTCDECNDAYFNSGGIHTSHTVNVGADWQCYIYYRTPITGNETNYQNKISGGGKEYTSTVLPSAGAGIVKSGRMEDGTFKWTVDMNIPAGSYYQWYVWDTMKVKGPNDLSVKKICDFVNATVQAFYNDNWIDVPKVDNATASDPFAWQAEPYEGGDCGLYLLNQCTCSNSNHCTDWSESDQNCRNRNNGADGTHFCYCWSQPESVALRVTYETLASTDIISQYGGNGNYLSNYAQMSAQTAKENGQPVNGGETTANVTIPGVFSKRLLASASADNNYTAQFRITVNEEMKDLSQMSSTGGIAIVDKMSNTLFYERGSMVIKRTDTSGDVATMTLGTDYTVDVSNDFHTITINIFEPGKYLYQLEYNAALNVLGQSGALVYDNSATVTLLGKTYTATIDNQTLSDHTSTAENFRVTITKTNQLNPAEILSGAQFGLYNQSGGLVASGYTSETGTLVFQTNITQGIVFHTDAPYYLQEISPPAGYILDSTRYWFYFAKNVNAQLEAEYPRIDHFPYQESIYMGSLEITNRPYTPVLPDTGGLGTLPYAIGGLLLIAASLLYRYVFRRKNQERRAS